MALVVRLSVAALLTYILPKAVGVLHGATEGDLDRLFSEYDIVHPTVISSAGRFITHDIKNADIFTAQEYTKRRRRSLDDFDTVVVSLSEGSNVVRRVNNSIDVRNDMYYNDDNETLDETDIMAATRRRYAAFRSRTITTTMPSPPTFVHFNVSAFGASLHLKVEAKRRLVAPGAKSVIFTSDGGRVEKDLTSGCLYYGRIPQHPGSRVAISNCDGLAGLIKTENDEFFIEPIEQQADASTPQRHVIYRRSATSQSANIGKRMDSEPAARDVEPNVGHDSLANSLTTVIGETEGISRKRKRHAKRNDYNMEIMLTADSEVVRFHGRDHVENYLLTLINIVDEIYHDSTLGEHINIVLSRMYQLDEARSNSLIVRDSPSTSLKNVCRWAHDTEQANPAPHGRSADHAIFLTRQKFGPAGYAHVTGMCHPLRSCSLNHEDGFSSAFVVAHETGHVLGMEHDGEGNKCGDETGIGSIMASRVQAAFHRYRWSRCSEQELKTNLPNFTCLLDDPHMPNWGPTPMYPGVTYTMDDQCRFDFGQGYKRCRAFRNMNICKTLWCSHDDNPLFCKTKKGPPIDGTKCGENMWCFKSHCVWRDQRQGAVDGNWGSWSSYGECSRSCGTGVMYRNRRCDDPAPSHGGSDCIGQNVDFDLCSKRPCPDGRDFRADQCMYRNNEVEYHGQRHKWLPYEMLDSDLKCDLFCVSKKTNVVVSMGDMVADGTLCSYDNPHGICKRGDCVEIGCDQVIGSALREDDCGVCGGDGRQCRNINGDINKRASRKVNSYMKIYKIPSGSRHIRIQEVRTEDNSNVLALKSRADNRYFLNARTRRVNEDATPYRSINVGAMWNYDIRGGIETITARGPINSDVKLMILVQRRNVPISVRYSYIVHMDAVSRPRDTYRFDVRKWTACSVACGVGVRRARFGCRSVSGGKWVNKRNCAGRPPRPSRKRCAVECNARWVVGHWSACSKSCGSNGVQDRAVSCQQSNAAGQLQIVNSNLCRQQQPPPRQICNPPPCPAKWRNGAWSHCSVTCGIGIQRRQVMCRAPGRARASAESACADERPSEVQRCQITPCRADDIQPANTDAPASHDTSTRDDGCVKDSSIFCLVEMIAQYCVLASYRELCCRSCHNFLSTDEGQRLTAGQPSLGRPLTFAIHPVFNFSSFPEESDLTSSNNTDNADDPSLEAAPTDVAGNDGGDLVIHPPIIPHLVIDDNDEEAIEESPDEITLDEPVDETMTDMGIETSESYGVDDDDDDIDEEGYYDDVGEEYVDGDDGLQEFILTLPPRNETTTTLAPTAATQDLMMPHVRNGTETMPLMPSPNDTADASRRKRSVQPMSVLRSWSECQVETCGAGTRHSIYGCWNRIEKTWASSRSCSHPEPLQTVCVMPCYARPKSMVIVSQHGVTYRQNFDCREVKKPGPGPRRASQVCRGLRDTHSRPLSTNFRSRASKKLRSESGGT